MSPVETCGTTKWCERRTHCVPLPAPCLPRTTSLTPGITDPLLEEALVVAHHQLAVDLAHGLQRHTDRDEQRRAVKGERVEVPQRHEDGGHDSDRAEEHRTHHGDPAEDVGEVPLRRRPGPDARDEATLFAD